MRDYLKFILISSIILSPYLSSFPLLAVEPSKIIENNHSTTTQSKKIRGKVLDEQGEPLIGATVLVKSTGKGCVTDLNGGFVIDSPKENVELEVSYIGYQTQVVKASSKKSIVITLREDATALDEVVVIGYGNVSREALTGSVSSVSGKTLSQIPVTTAAEAMVGKLAGVQITSEDGSPDADIMVRVRGGGSITQDNSPLYLVDGFPVDNLKDIAPTDIESIDVLKDASSTAVYGARGANGVVNITTKRAKSGKISVSFNAYVKASQLSKKLDVLDPYEFVLMQYEYYRQRSSTPTGFTDRFGEVGDFDLYRNYDGDDWQEDVIGGTSYSGYYNLSIGGSTPKSQYNLSLTHSNSPGIMVGNGQEKTFLNFKLKTQLFKFLDFEYNTRFVNQRTRGDGTTGIKIMDCLRYTPTEGLRDFMSLPEVTEDFTPEEEDYIVKYSPVENVFQNWKQKGGTLFNTTAALNFKFSKYLTFRSEFGIDFNWSYQKRFYGPKNSNAERYSDGMPYVELTRSEAPKYRLANVLTYRNRFIKRHDLNVMFGQEMTSSQTISNFSSVRYLPMDITPEKAFDNMTLGDSYIVKSSKSTPNRMLSFFGRLMYNYDSRYYATLTMRADGSTIFAPGNQWGIFPAASLAWRISEENFMKKSFFTDLKLRIGIGTSGNNRIASDLWKNTYQLATNGVGWGESMSSYYTYGSNYLPNPSLTWEKTITKNVGIDFGVLRGKLSGTLEFYVNDTKDLLVPSTVPQSTGYKQQLTNVGKTRNTGVELTLNSTLVNSKKFSLNANFNIGINKNKITALASGEPTWLLNSGWGGTGQVPYYDYRINVGESVGRIYGFVNDGFYTVDDFDYINGDYQLKEGVVDCSILTTVYPGAPKFKKIGKTTEGERNPILDANDDVTLIGKAMPKCTGGFGLNAAYNGFDLSLFFNFMIGNDVYNGNKMMLTSFYSNSYNNLSTSCDSKHRFRYFDNEGNDLRNTPEALKEFNKNATIWNSTRIGQVIVMSDNVEDGSFLRLNTVTLGYTLPIQLTKKWGISNLRFYLTGYNLWLLTKYTGYDPEVNVSNGVTPGIDYNKYPRSRTYTLGVNVTF